MPGIKETFSTVFVYDEFWTVTGSVTAVQFPTGTCGMVRFKAHPDNVGLFLLGQDANNTVFPFAAGDDSGWVATTNLNRYWHQNLSGTSDFLHFWLQK